MDLLLLLAAPRAPPAKNPAKAASANLNLASSLVYVGSIANLWAIPKPSWPTSVIPSTAPDPIKPFPISLIAEEKIFFFGPEYKSKKACSFS